MTMKPKQKTNFVHVPNDKENENKNRERKKRKTREGKKKAVTTRNKK